MEANDIVFRNANGVPVTTSHLVAETFKKPHYQVLRDIDNLECSEAFRESNFVFSFKIREIANGGHKEDRYYTITRDGFTFLAMGYTGKKAAEFKEKYIAAFNAMEQQLRQGTPQISAQFVETQMQMMNQMMQLCGAMMQHIGMNTSAAPSAPQAPAHRTDKRTDTLPSAPRGPKRPGVLIGYDRLRTHYREWITVSDTARELRRRGVDTSVHRLFKYLRTEGYVHSENEWFNCPTDESVRLGYMVGVTSGEKYGTSGCKVFHTPYLSPLFVDTLHQMLHKSASEPNLPFGKEVQP